MLSEFQKRKIHHLFDILDIDKNGFLQPKDFINVGKRIIEKANIESNSRKAQLILTKSNRLFIQMLTDSNTPDLTLMLYDWVEFFREQLSKEISGGSILEYYIRRTSRHIFDLFDLNGDRMMSQDEYLNMLSVYQIPHEYAVRGFHELDTNKDHFISIFEMTQGLRNFFLSDDIEAPGNYIFGTL